MGEASPGVSYQAAIARAMEEHQSALTQALDDWKASAADLAEVAGAIVGALRAGHKILTAGNGGSAADAQHFSAELVGRYKRERSPYAAVALTTDTSILTAIGNDYGYEDVFARQVRALGRPGDVLLAYSTSGESDNLIRAADEAHRRGMTVIALTGPADNNLARRADIALRMPATDTPVIQEMHLMTTHLLCDLVETELAGAESQQQAANGDERGE
jgi:D-sedoheptulose 7-phosphate isomerase